MLTLVFGTPQNEEERRKRHLHYLYSLDSA